MKKKTLLLLIVMIMAVMVTGCTRAMRDTFTRSRAAENGRIMRHIIVQNSRTDRLIWEGTGMMNLRNASNGDYEIIIWHDNNETTRELFNGRDNYIHVHDMTNDEITKYKASIYKHGE
jgi:hypothetical protein